MTFLQVGEMEGDLAGQRRAGSKTGGGDGGGDVTHRLDTEIGTAGRYVDDEVAVISKRSPARGQRIVARPSQPSKPLSTVTSSTRRGVEKSHCGGMAMRSIGSTSESVRHTDCV